MTDLINGRTPEEIKKALDESICKDRDCRDCVYWNAMREEGSCLPAVYRDALALVQRFEAERDAALAKVPKWISVEEKLPDTDGEYLVLKRHNYCKEDGYVAQGVALFFRMRDPEWVVGNLLEVTHWMPLPELPEVE